MGFIIEKKRAEKRLENSEERLRILFDYAPDAYYLNDLKGSFIDGNKEAEKLTGYKKEELIGKSFLKLKILHKFVVHPLSFIPKAASLLAKNARWESTGPEEFILNRKDGSQIAVEIKTFPVKIEGQRQILGIARDISERNRIEKMLKQQAAFFNKNPGPVLQAGYEGNIIAHNPVAKKLFRKDLTDKSIFSIFPGLDKSSLKIDKSGNTIQFEQIIKEKSFLFTVKKDEFTR